jgi:hypothetical protein
VNASEQLFEDGFWPDGTPRNRATDHPVPERTPAPEDGAAERHFAAIRESLALYGETHSEYLRYTLDVEGMRGVVALTAALAASRAEVAELRAAAKDATGPHYVNVKCWHCDGVARLRAALARGE